MVFGFSFFSRVRGCLKNININIKNDYNKDKVECLSATFREYTGASFVEKKSKIYFLISDDILHD